MYADWYKCYLLYFSCLLVSTYVVSEQYCTVSANQWVRILPVPYFHLVPLSHSGEKLHVRPTADQQCKALSPTSQPSVPTGKTKSAIPAFLNLNDQHLDPT